MGETACYEQTAGSARSLQNRGSELAEEGDFVEAIQCFEQALAVGKSAELFESIAQCHMMIESQESIHKAIAAATEAIELSPKWGDGYLTLGRAHLSAQNFEDAVTAFRSALQFQCDPVEVEEEMQAAVAAAEKHKRRLEKALHNDADWNRRRDIKIRRARSIRRPGWSESDWTRHSFAKLQLHHMFQDCVDNIMRVDAFSSSAEEFGKQYQALSKPALLSGAMKSWEAMREWSIDSFVAAFGHADLVCDHRFGVHMRMADFKRYMDSQEDDTPLYIFDHMFTSRPATRHLSSQCHVPAIFSEDLLEKLGPSLRPPTGWLLIGPRRSGSALHKDPLGTSAWNALIAGTKLWVLFPPSTPREWLCPDSEDASEQSTIVDSASCWFIWWWKQRSRAAQWPVENRPIEFFQHPGEIVFVPARWWHAVLNLDDTIAVTQNFCNRWNLKDVWCCTATTHPVLARHIQRCAEVEMPELHRRLTLHPPEPVVGDDPRVSYADVKAEAMPTARAGAGSQNGRREEELSSSSDEEYLVCVRARDDRKRQKMEVGTAQK